MDFDTKDGMPYGALKETSNSKIEAAIMRITSRPLKILNKSDLDVILQMKYLVRMIDGLLDYYEKQGYTLSEALMYTTLFLSSKNIKQSWYTPLVLDEKKNRERKLKRKQNRERKQQEDVILDAIAEAEELIQE